MPRPTTTDTTPTDDPNDERIQRLLGMIQAFMLSVPSLIKATVHLLVWIGLLCTAIFGLVALLRILIALWLTLHHYLGGSVL